MLTLILADSELELIPEEMIDDYAVRKNAKSNGKVAREMLLDSNLMQSSIERIFPGESRRRGRPDLVHLFLLTALESIPGKEGNLRVFVHTRNNEVISFNPEVRIPRAYNRFVGLIEDLFRKRKISSGDKVLMSMESKSLESLLDSLGDVRKVLMWPEASISTVSEIIGNDREIAFVIGGFSQGDFRSDVSGLTDRHSIFRDELVVWTVASEIICGYRSKHSDAR